MVTTRNMMRSGVESPGENTTPKKLPVRSKDDKTTTKDTPKSTPKATPRKGSAKKDKNESNRPSSKKTSALVEELSADSTPSKNIEDQGHTVIKGPEQPAPEVEEKIVNDSEPSSGSGNEVMSPEAEPAEEKKVPETEAADDSDSDEAPEAVSTSKAAAQAKKSAQAANKAIQEQAAAQKRKRQERNIRLQEQAASRKTQKAAAAEEAKHAQEEEEEEEEGDEQEKPTAALVKSGRRTKLDIPDELPAEFLKSDDEDEGQGEGADSGRKPRKIRKLHTAAAQMARDGRSPRDEVVGSTIFRVVKKQDERLAPKAQKQSVNAKKALLARNRTSVKARKGFFV